MPVWSLDYMDTGNIKIQQMKIYSILEEGKSCEY